MGTRTYTIRTGTTPTATKVIEAGEGPHLIWNRDLINTIYIGDDNTLRIGDEGLVAIDPNGSIAVDGETDKYVISSVNGVQVSTILGGMSNFRGLSIANGSLVLPSLHSPGFVHGITGWSINKDDSAEFNNLTIRGTFIGTNWFINASGEFFYTGTPGLGNLSISHVPGTVNVSDGNGNIALPGDTIYQTPIALNTIAFNIQQGIITWFLWNGSNWGFGPSIDWTLANNFVEFLGAPIRSISGTRSNPTLISTDSWTNFSIFGANFGAGGPAPAQVLMPAGPNNSGCVKLRGQIVATAATGANATMVSIIGGGPPANMSWITPTNAAGYTPPARVITVDIAGNVRMQPTMALNNFVLLDGIEIPLG
jgi:hypothetical protein